MLLTKENPGNVIIGAAFLHFHDYCGTDIVPRRLFFAAQQRIAMTLSPEYYQKMQRSTTGKNQEQHGPEVK